MVNFSFCATGTYAMILVISENSRMFVVFSSVWVMKWLHRTSFESAVYTKAATQQAS